jgi:hypothetical protein
LWDTIAVIVKSNLLAIISSGADDLFHRGPLWLFNQSSMILSLFMDGHWLNLKLFFMNRAVTLKPCCLPFNLFFIDSTW